MRNRNRSCRFGIVISGIITFGQVAIAGPYEDANDAFYKGDYKTYLKILEPLAIQGSPKAQTWVGDVYVFGRGVPQDFRQAYKWYRLAATQGNSDAQTYLGGIYRDGAGVAPDPVKAHMWYNVAASTATTDSRRSHLADLRDTVSKQMAPDQITQAQEMATKCFASKFKDCD